MEGLSWESAFADADRRVHQEEHPGEVAPGISGGAAPMTPKEAEEMATKTLQAGRGTITLIGDHIELNDCYLAKVSEIAQALLAAYARGVNSAAGMACQRGVDDEIIDDIRRSLLPATTKEGK